MSSLHYKEGFFIWHQVAAGEMLIFTLNRNNCANKEMCLGLYRKTCGLGLGTKRTDLIHLLIKQSPWKVTSNLL